MLKFMVSHFKLAKLPAASYIWTRLLLLLASLSLSGCILKPPRAADLPSSMQQRLYYVNNQPNSSFDDQITRFLQSLGVQLTEQRKQAQAELQINSLSLNTAIPSLADANQATTISYTQTVNYQVTNLKNQRVYGPTAVSSSANEILPAGQLTPQDSNPQLAERLQYTCILLMFNQLSSATAKLQLAQKKPKKIYHPRYTSKHKKAYSLQHNPTASP